MFNTMEAIGISTLLPQIFMLKLCSTCLNNTTHLPIKAKEVFFLCKLR